jgi:pyruvate kinase
MCLLLQITFTTRPINGGKEDAGYLPVSYSKFPSMCIKGDTIFLGKYLVTGSEESSLYLTVSISASQLACAALLEPNLQQQWLLTWPQLWY